MKQEMVRQVMSKADAMWLRMIGVLTEGKEFKPRDKMRGTVARTWKRSPIRKRLEEVCRQLPDTQVEELNTRLDTLPRVVRKMLSENLPNLPANRGGRPPAFPIDIRRHAIEDLAHELPRRDFSEAVETVARRYGMSPDYLRKVWKNRRHLNESKPVIPLQNLG